MVLNSSTNMDERSTACALAIQPLSCEVLNSQGLTSAISICQPNDYSLFSSELHECSLEMKEYTYIVMPFSDAFPHRLWTWPHNLFQQMGQKQTQHKQKLEESLSFPLSHSFISAWEQA